MSYLVSFSAKHKHFHPRLSTPDGDPSISEGSPVFVSLMISLKFSSVFRKERIAFDPEKNFTLQKIIIQMLQFAMCVNM